MKLRQISFKIVSLVMVFAILFSVSATTISAAAQSIEHTTATETTDKHYVSIGDSMTNGYGFTGYEQGSDDLDFIGGGEGIYGKNAYPELFAAYLASKGYNVEHTKLASSALRAEDLFYLLGGLETPSDDWFEEVNHYTNCDDDAKLQNHFQSAVKDADVISLGIGNASFGAFLVSRLTGIIGVMGSAPEENIYKLDNSLIDHLTEKEAALVYEVYNSAVEYFNSALSEEMAAKYPVTDAAELIAYTVVNFLVGFRGSVEKIAELNPDAQIILIGLMNTTYGLNLVVEGEKIPFGDYMDEMFALLNAYIVGLPTLLQAEGEMVEITFGYAEQTNPEFICQVFDDMAALGWDEEKCDAATGLSAETVRGRTLKAYNSSLRYALSGALGMDLPEVSLQDVQIFEAAVAEQGEVSWGYYEGYNDPYIAQLFAEGRYGEIEPYVLSVYPAKNISIAIALAIEDAVALTCELTDIPVEGLENIASPEGLLGVFSPEALGSLSGAVPSELRHLLANYLAGEDANPTVKGMCKIYGLFKIGDGMCVHPTPKSHGELVKDIIDAYEYEAIPADVVLEKFGDVYSFADKLGVIGSTPELEVMDEIYTYLDSNDYITGEQTLAILLETYVCIKDEVLSSDDLTNIAKFTYETLVRNALLSDSDRVAIIGNVYFILKNNEYLNNITALTVVEEIYTALAAEKLINDTQSYQIVDYVYDIIIDGTVTDADLLNIIRFVYYTLVKNDNSSMLRYARSGMYASSDDEAKAAKTIRIIFATVSETYLSEENKESVQTLITGEGALINDKLLLKLAENIMKDLEENEGSDDLTSKLIDTATTTILNDPDTDPAVKVQIAEELGKVAVNNGVIDTEDESVLELGVALKIYQRLSDAGLLTDAQVMSIVTYLYPVLVSGEALETEQVVEIVAYVFDVVFGREDLTLEDKINIVVIVYEVLEEEGYITEENINSVIDSFVDYIENNYEEMYASAHTELRNNGTIAELNAALLEALEALDEARLAVEGYEVIDTLAPAKVTLLKELALAQATIAEIKILVNYETITDETLEQLEVLLALLEEHLDNVATLSAQVGSVALDQVVVVLELTDKFLQEFTKAAYAYILENAPVLYEQLVDFLTDAVAEYSHEAAKYAYSWLINNPEKVIGFFDTYGADIAGFIGEYYEIIFGVLGYVGYTYGEDLFYLVLDNADVILPAVAGWFEIHGDLAWDLVVVYFYAVVEYYNLGIDLSSPEGVLDMLNKVFALLGDLLNLVKDEAYDYLEALGVIEQINYQLAKLNAYIRDLIGDRIAEIEKILDTLVNSSEEELKAELENQLTYLDKALQSGVKALAGYIYDLVSAFVNDAIRGEFTPNEDTYYVSVNGGEALYADLLAEALSKNLDSAITLDKTTWGAIDYDMLAKADLVTIGFDQNELTDFAVAQLLGYINDLVDGKVRGDANAYVASVFVALGDYYAEIQDAAGALGFIVPDFDFDVVEESVLAELNGAVDAVIGEGELNFELDAELSATLEMVGDLLADKDAEELDWSKFVPESELHYVDELRAELRNELLENGIPETFSYDINVLDYVFENYEALGLTEAFKYMDTEIVREKLASVATYTFSVPVVDSLVFAIESYIYSNLEFQYNYGKLILDLYEINPDATVILLGHYNAFNYELTFGGETLDLSEAYAYIAGVSSVQPFAYALLSEKVAYVDISDAETYYETYVNAGVDNNLVNFVLAYLADSTVTDVTVAGHTYIYEQIMGILTVGCEHKYDNACDTTCNKCGAIREVGDHVYVDGVCIHCGHKLPVDDPTKPTEPEHVHVYDDCLDAVCNTCGETREVIGHVFDHCEDTTCYKCGFTREKIYHSYDDCEDATCNHCGLTRPVYGHNYDNACDAECNACGKTREVEGHVYSGCTDTTCNVCGLVRQASAHKVDNCADNICNVCGQNVAVFGHKFGAWNVTVEPGRKTEGQKVRTCSGCGLAETKAIAALGGLGGGAIAGITVGSVVIGAAAGFAIFWFIIQKKTFAELLALLGKGGAEAAVATAGAEAGAEAVATEAAAEAVAEEATEAVAEETAEAVAEETAETVAE